MKKSLKGGSPRRGTPPVAALPSSSSSSEVKQDQSEGPDRDMGHTNMAYNTAEERVTAPSSIRGPSGPTPAVHRNERPDPANQLDMNEKKPHPRQASVTPVTYPAPVFSPPALAQSEGRLNDGNEAPASGGPRIEFHRNYCRSVPGSLGIIEVVGAGFIVTALSFRGFIFDVFFFLCNLGFTYTLVGSMFFINGLLLPGPITGGRPELPLLVSVQYYGLGFIMFLAGGIAALVKSQRDALAIVTGTAAVLVAIALFLHVIYNVRNS